MTTLGVGWHPWAPNVPRALTAAAQSLGVPVRGIDLPSVTVDVDTLSVRDADGPVEVTHLAPALLYLQPAAALGYEVLERRAAALNPVVAAALADDKARAAAVLAAAGVPQLPTVVAPLDHDHVRSVAGEVGYPVVLKRAHGAQGRWVRRAAAPVGLPAILDEFRAEGPGAVVVQRFAAAAAGRSVRVIVTGGCVAASTERSGADGEWRSNIARGGTQRRVELTAAERDMSLRAVAALGLGHAGVDLLRLPGGSIVLEVNACPDFTSMLPHVDVDLAAQLVRAAIQLGA